MKNLLDFCFATVVFWCGGIRHHVRNGQWLRRERAGSFFTMPATRSRQLGADADHWTAKFLFQLVFAGTAATIVSGAMAERTKFSCYLILQLRYQRSLSTLFPATGSGAAAGSARRAFLILPARPSCTRSAAGSAVRGDGHRSPASGSTVRTARQNAIPGHNFPLMILGVFILWLGWFGFNPGSTMMASGDGDPSDTSPSPRTRRRVPGQSPRCS